MTESVFHISIARSKVVNAEAREEVINNRRANFTGCNDGSDKPTCGQMLINGEPISSSQVRIHYRETAVSEYSRMYRAARTRTNAVSPSAEIARLKFVILTRPFATPAQDRKPSRMKFIPRGGREVFYN